MSSENVGEGDGVEDEEESVQVEARGQRRGFERRFGLRREDAGRVVWVARSVRVWHRAVAQLRNPAPRVGGSEHGEAQAQVFRKPRKTRGQHWSVNHGLSRISNLRGNGISRSCREVVRAVLLLLLLLLSATLLFLLLLLLCLEVAWSLVVSWSL